MTKIDPTATKPGRPDDRAGQRPEIVPARDDEARFASRPPIQLLVSVRERSELLVALAAGVDIIDLKEPRLGALSPVQPRFWRETVDIWNQADPAPDQTCPDPRCPDQGPEHRSARPPLSAALGEPQEALAIAHQLPEAFRFAKVGPSGCDSVDKLRRLWQTTRNRLHDDIQLVAVSYADHIRAQCVSPQLVFEAASHFGLETCLIDTYIKDGQSTLDLLGLDGVGRISDIARDRRLRWTLAGSVRAGDVATLRSAGVSPHCIGVRGDVCLKGRTGTLVAGRIGAWKNALKA